MDLEETTDREGFRDSPYYRNFYALLLEFKRFTDEAHEFFGRAWSSFQKSKREQLARVDSRKSVEDVSSAIRAGLKKVGEHRKSVGALRARLKSELHGSSTVIKDLSGAKQITSPEHQRQLRDASESLQALAREATSALDDLGTALESLDEYEKLGQVLDDRVDSLRRQMDDVYETVALGLTAEALSHEIFQIADKLAQRTKTAEARLPCSRRARSCGLSIHRDRAFLGGRVAQADLVPFSFAPLRSRD